MVLNSGKTIYAYSHNHRAENWTIVKGKVSIVLNCIDGEFLTGQNIDVPIGCVHQISKVGSFDAVFVETACGEILHKTDMGNVNTPNLSENQLEIQIEPFIKLSPVFKDYLWDDTKLRDVYGKKVI